MRVRVTLTTCRFTIDVCPWTWRHAGSALGDGVTCVCPSLVAPAAPAGLPARAPGGGARKPGRAREHNSANLQKRAHDRPHDNKNYPCEPRKSQERPSTSFWSLPAGPSRLFESRAYPRSTRRRRPPPRCCSPLRPRPSAAPAGPWTRTPWPPCPPCPRPRLRPRAAACRRRARAERCCCRPRTRRPNPRRCRPPPPAARSRGRPRPTGARPRVQPRACRRRRRRRSARWAAGRAPCARRPAPASCARAPPRPPPTPSAAPLR
mmetsp:Transcript_6994/g.20465  ORF Transcript_6994/g.20465 Transcript_6994/m.20465 type:complete len:263 (-) Transcript_6994:373-1161(-)